jgi:rhamnosyltransferase
MRICSVTVLYHPDDAVYKNICSYYDYVEKLYIIDNTEAENKNDWIKDNAGGDKAGKIVYVRSGINTGVAAALNSACRLAMADGFDWILTMDQDSNLKALDFFKFCTSFIHDDDIGIISASFSNNMPFKKQHLDHSYELLFAITSGNLLRLNAWSVTVFNEKLFIDEVDNDFCLRLKKNGFRILTSKEILLNHSIGEIKRIRFFTIKK